MGNTNRHSEFRLGSKMFMVRVWECQVISDLPRPLVDHTDVWSGRSVFFIVVYIICGS